MKKLWKNQKKQIVQNKMAYQEQVIKESYLAMGTIVTFIACYNSREGAREAFKHALQEINRLEKIFSRHDKNSALSSLNEHAKLIKAPEELLFVLEKSKQVAALAPLYNPAIKPLLDLFEKYQNPEQIAQNIDEKEIQDAKEKALFNEVIIEDKDILFNQEGMGITLDSLAKGFIIDKASEVLMAKGIVNHVINAGGDIIARGHKERNQPWVIAIESPHNPSQYLAQFPLVDSAVATSGAYQRFYDIHKTRHHIINPIMGKSPELYSITCKTDSAMLADAYATACSLGACVFDKFKVQKKLAIA